MPWVARHGRPCTVKPGSTTRIRPGDTSAVPTSSETLVTILNATQQPEYRDSSKPRRPRSSTSCTLPGKSTGNMRSAKHASDAVGKVEDLATGSSPAIARTPPWGPTPAKLAWRNRSPVRSTPGALPYHMPSTPSYLGLGKAAASWPPKTMVPPSSSFSPGMKRTLCSASSAALRWTFRSKPPSGEPGYPEMMVAVLSPRRLSARC